MQRIVAGVLLIVDAPKPVPLAKTKTKRKQDSTLLVTVSTTGKSSLQAFPQTSLHPLGPHRILIKYLLNTSRLTVAKIKVKGKRVQARQQDQDSRSAILRAALREFGQEGFGGARTEHIAEAADVNIAMLFYHFKNKEQLYGAVLEEVVAGLAKAVMPALQSNLPPAEKLLAYISAHFDYVAQSPVRPCLVQREMMRSGRSGSPHIRRLAKLYFAPVQRKFNHMVEEGISSGEFRNVDIENLIYSAVAVINSYFTSRPVIEVLSGSNSLTPARIQKRKQQVIQFLSNALLNEARGEAHKVKNGFRRKAWQ